MTKDVLGKEIYLFLFLFLALIAPSAHGTPWQDCENPYVVLGDPGQYSQLEMMAEELTRSTPFIAEVGKLSTGEVYVDFIVGKSPPGQTLSPEQLKEYYFETGAEDFAARQLVGSGILSVGWTESFSRGMQQMSQAVDIATQLGKPITQVEGYVSDGLKDLVDSGKFSIERFSKSWNALRQQTHPSERWVISLEKREGRTYLVRKRTHP